MECREVQQLLDAFAADELEAAQRQTVERHLAECPVCQKEAQALRQTISLLGQFKEMDPPAVFLQELRQRMEKRQRRSILDRLLPRPVFARVLAAVSCLLVAGFGVWLVVKQLLPPAEVEERYAGDKLEGDRLALLDKKEKSVDESVRVTTAGEPISERLPESINGDIAASEIHLRNGAVRQEIAKYAGAPERPSASPDAEARGIRAIDTRLGSAERPAEPPLGPAATTAPKEPAVADYAAQLEDRERLAEELHARAAGRTTGKAGASEPGGDARLSDRYGHPKGGRAPTIDTEQMARRGAAGVELKVDEKREGVTPPAMKEEAGAFRARASQEVEEEIKDEEGTASARQHRADVPTEDAAVPGAALQVQHGKMGKSDVDFLAEEFTVPVTTVNGSKADWGDMTGQVVREQEQWYFYGLGNFLKGYDRLDSPTPELVMLVRDIPQARAEIQKAVAEIGGSFANPMAGLTKSKGGEEGEQESFGAERSFVLSDSSTGLPLRDSRTDSLVVRLKPGTYEAFRQKLFVRPAGVVSGPQPPMGTKAVAIEEKAQKKEEEVTLLIRLIELTEQQSQEVLPADSQPQSP